MSGRLGGIVISVPGVLGLVVVSGTGGAGGGVVGGLMVGGVLSPPISPILQLVLSGQSQWSFKNRQN